MNEMRGETQLHFLIVDDDAESRATIVEYLRSMGYNRMTLAHDGADAIRSLDRDGTLNFIISDWEMPLMNGLNLLQRIRANPYRSHIPFLLMTAPVSMETQKIILAAENQVDAYMIKPFPSHVLLEKIQATLDAATFRQTRQVVVVDDDVSSRETILEYVGEIGFKKVISFQEGASALGYLKQHSTQVGLIVSDWEMPKMNGIEFLRMCKSEPTLANIPFIMVTSQSSIEQMKVTEAALSSVDEYILKPFKFDEFRKRVKAALQRTKLEDEQ